MASHSIRSIILVLLLAANAILASKILAADDEPPKGHCDVCVEGPRLIACCVLWECGNPFTCNCRATSQCNSGAT